MSNAVIQFMEGKLLDNIVDYIYGTGSLSFLEKEFNLVDSLIFSQLSYLKFTGIVPDLNEDKPPVNLREAALKQNPNLLFQEVWDIKRNRELLSAVIRSHRFRNTMLNFYRDELDETNEKQFSAITFLLDNGTSYVAFRGTDTTIVGWKEDFNMAFKSPVPAQEAGLEYLTGIADKLHGEFKIGGHSKGGNIAVYSAIKCSQEIKQRISDIYSHDGPGFKEELLNSEEYRLIQTKIHKSLTQSSLIGMLLSHQEHYTVVKSNRFWIMQHDPFSWKIENSNFKYANSVKSSTLFMNKTLNEWINTLDDETRGLFIETLYQIIKSTKAKTLRDLKSEWRKNTIAAFHATKEIDKETKQFIWKTLASFLLYLGHSMRLLKKTSIKKTKVKFIHLK